MIMEQIIVEDFIQAVSNFFKGEDTEPVNKEYKGCGYSVKLNSGKNFVNFTIKSMLPEEFQNPSSVDPVLKNPDKTQTAHECDMMRDKLLYKYFRNSDQRMCYLLNEFISSLPKTYTKDYYELLSRVENNNEDTLKLAEDIQEYLKWIEKLLNDIISMSIYHLPSNC